MRPGLCSLLLAASIICTADRASSQNCVDVTHCDYMAARLMTSGESCGSFDPSQTAEYSRLVTGARDFGTFPVGTLYPVFVFDERMDGLFGADDPGSNSPPNPCGAQPALSPLPPGRGLFIDFLTEVPTAGGPARNLLYWDGVDDDENGLDENDVEWTPVPTDEFLAIDELGTTATADGGTSEIEGIQVEVTSASGGIHDHIDFRLRRSEIGLASLGVYLARFDLTMPGFAEGAPSYTVFATVSVPAGAEFVARKHVENELVKPLCMDGVDNDRDGFVDFAGGDPGCDSALDESEKSDTHPCDDGIDNDLDGHIDFRATDFGVAGLFATRDLECTSPTDASGESFAEPVPALGPLGIAALIALIAIVGLRRVRGAPDS